MALVNTPYALSLLSEYTHTLDSLPLDLSRNFADLRELDAVLSSSILSITTKIHNLTTMIEEDTASKEDRLWLLTEIAEDAQRLKLGGEDKIRVACHAADNLKGHSTHLRALSEHIPAFDASVLNRTTVYPHVSERAYMPAMTMETGRRRRGAFGSLLVANNPDPSPAKRKRVPKDDDIDIGTGRSPKKPTVGEGNSRARNNGRAKKNERAVSPSESLVSVTSHLPQQIGHSISARGGGANGRAGNGAGAVNNKRARASASNANRNPTPLANEAFPGNHDSRRGAAADNFPPSTSHPSLPPPYQNGHASGSHVNGYDAHGLQHIPGAQNWAIPPAQQLEGPGMPPARGTPIHTNAPNVAVVANSAVDATDAGDGDGDGDDRTYCFCDGVSYGEMIACDDEHCEREWFHLGCIGLEAPPDGTWYCDACKGKRTTKRSARGGKRRAGGNRAGAKG